MIRMAVMGTGGCVRSAVGAIRGFRYHCMDMYANHGVSWQVWS